MVFLDADAVGTDSGATGRAERSDVMRRVEIERRLRSDVDGPQLSLHFHPIMEQGGAKVGGFEALLHWGDEHGDIHPSEFVPVAEESGLIVPIGEFALDEACRQVAYWRANVPGGADLYISVNISPRQLVAPHIVDTVADALDRHGVPASALRLEITETAMTEDTTMTAAAVSGLRLLGVHLALGDFGCTQVQGFLDSPAIPADQVPALLHRLQPAPRARRHLAVRSR